MDFQNLGKHCAVSSCHQHDFLPFTCNCCNKAFCLAHRDVSSHQCPNTLKGDARTIVCPLCSKSLHYDSGSTSAEELWNRHAATDCRQGNHPQAYQQKKAGKVCASKGCHEKLTLTNTCVCKTCRKELCLKHRFEDEHECGKYNPPSRPQVNNPPMAYSYTTQPLQAQRPVSQGQCRAQVQAPSQNQGQDQGGITDKISSFFSGIGSMFKSKGNSQNTCQVTVQNPPQNLGQYQVRYNGQQHLIQYQYTSQSLMQFPVQNNGQTCNNNRSREVCQVCGQGFSTQYELTTHYQSRHC